MNCYKCGCPGIAHKYPYCPPDFTTAKGKILPIESAWDKSTRGFGFIPENQLNKHLPIILVPGMMYEINGFLIISKRPIEDTTTRVYVTEDTITIKADQPVEISIKRTV